MDRDVLKAQKGLGTSFFIEHITYATVRSVSDKCKIILRMRRTGASEGSFRVKGVMITTKDKIWLKKVIDECFCEKDERNSDERTLKGFGMLVRSMVKNIEKNLDETQALWERDSNSEELKGRFNLLKKCLFYLERFCQEKIEGGKENG